MIFSTIILQAEWIKVDTPGKVDTRYFLVDEDNIYLSTGLTTEIYLSNDNGESWDVDFSVDEDITVNRFMFFDDIIIAATYGKGIMISYDNGETWEEKNTGLPYSIPAQQVRNISRIYENNGTIYSDPSTLHKSNDKGETWEPVLFNGKNWSPTDMAFDVNKMYCSFRRSTLDIEPGNAILLSEDNGETWKEIGDSLISVQDLLITDDYIYAIAEQGLVYTPKDNYNFQKIENWPIGTYLNNNSNLFNLSNKIATVSFWDGVNLSDESGQNWKNITNNLNVTFYYDLIEIENKIIVSTSQGLFATSDEGETWTPVTDGLLGDANVLDVESLDNSIFLNIAEEGFYRSDDMGSSWLDFTSEIEQKSFSKIKFHEKSAIITGYNSNTIYLIKDINNPSQFETKTFNQNRSIRGTIFFKNRVLAVSSNNEIGKQPGIYVYENISGDWSGFEDEWELTDSSRIRGINVFNDTLYASTIGDGITYSVDGYNWYNMENELAYIDPNTGQKLAKNISTLGISDELMFTHVEEEGTYISEDRGNSWQLINIDLKDARVGSYYISGDNVVLGTSKGFFYSNDKCQTIIDMNDGIGYPYARGMAVMGDTLYAGTPLGLYKMGLDKIITSVEVSEKVIDYLYAFPPFPSPAVNSVTARIAWDKSRQFRKENIRVYDYMGREVSHNSRIILERESDYSGHITWDCRDMEQGIYIIAVNHGSRTIPIKVVISR